MLQTIEEQGKLTPELRTRITEAVTLVAVDDLYRPYRPKKRTRAMIAKEKGLEPLANIILLQKTARSVEEEAASYVDAEKGVENVQQAIAGASDIIAEQVADRSDYRKSIREWTMKEGWLAVRAGASFQNDRLSRPCHQPGRKGEISHRQGGSAGTADSPCTL